MPDPNNPPDTNTPTGPTDGPHQGSETSAHEQAPGARTSVGELAIAILQTQFDALRSHETGTREGSDPGELHDMRVATRRLRAAFRVFAPALPPEADAFRQELGWLGSGLSAVRDLDVQLARLAEWQAHLAEDDRSALESIRDAIVAQRDGARRELLALLDSERYRQLLSSGAALLRLGPAPGWAEQPAVAELPAVIERSHRKVRKLGDLLGPDSPAASLHKLRIRAKRLRYAVEFAAELYGRPAERYVRRVADLQDLLGSHQDAHVAVGRLRNMAITHAGVLPPGSVFLLGELAQQYTAEELVLRSQLADTYAEIAGKRWKALRRRMRARRRSACASSARDDGS